jgi:hypothetical protein
MNIDFNNNQDIATHLQTNLLFNKKETLSVAIPTPTLSSSLDNTLLDLTNYLSSINVQDVIAINPSLWTMDETYEGLDYVQVIGYSKNSTLTILPKLFAAQSDGAPKAIVVTKLPVMKVLGKVGQNILKIYNDGSIFTPMTSTNNITLNPNRNDVKNIMTGAAYTNFLGINSVDGFSF